MKYPSTKLRLKSPNGFSLDEAVVQWLGLLQFTQETLSPELARLLNSSFSEALKIPEFSIKGVQLDGETESPKGPLVDIPSFHFRQQRTFRPQLNAIEPYHDDHPKDIAYEALRKSARHPEWVDVQIPRASFDTWLKEKAIMRGASPTRKSPMATANGGSPMPPLASIFPNFFFQVKRSATTSSTGSPVEPSNMCRCPTPTCRLHATDIAAR